ncbi:hypothetical protein RHMOL_Rhmol03G0271600 [Rhododendron molle]|uniref:Uncharacterized protein n=2 Tax=Rhododendron molle TaxID=49168 RepID=A0ACC0LAJ7_RHOML|nr:hypothetical protein RHMOL_Rhmol13G0224100 [Rhododendron molle]KAI8565585.1 hypothetical protein RHMOL_Rhmol03G0271600 [Rhododendron molle]
MTPRRERAPANSSPRLVRFLHGDFVAAVSNSTGQVGVVWLMSIFRWIFFSLLMDLL